MTRKSRCGDTFISTDDTNDDLICDRTGIHLVHRDQNDTKFVRAPGGAFVSYPGRRMTGPNKVRLVIIGVFLVLAALILWFPVAAAMVGSLILALLLTGQILRAFYAIRRCLFRPIRKPAPARRAES